MCDYMCEQSGDCGQDFFWLENKVQLDWNKQSGRGQKSDGEGRENPSLLGLFLRVM